MTRYLPGNLESRHILFDNDLRLERAKINVSRILFLEGAAGVSDYSYTM